MGATRGSFRREIKIVKVNGINSTADIRTTPVSNETLTNRSFVHMFRGLASEATKDPELERSIKTVDKLELKATRTTTGFDCFLFGHCPGGKDAHPARGEHVSG